MDENQHEEFNRVIRELEWQLKLLTEFNAERICQIVIDDLNKGGEICTAFRRVLEV